MLPQIDSGGDGKEEQAQQQALDTAWRIHAALTDWTGKVDSKAAYCFAVESAALVACINLASSGRLFGNLATLTTWLFRAGVALMVAAALCSGYVVMPRLRRRNAKKEWKANFIYFGHLRHWSSALLQDHLLLKSELLPVLTQQLVSMSKIAWQKHSMVQLSLALAAVGAALLGLCTYFTLSAG